MLSTPFGSPSSSHGKAPLNVVFIIDTYQPTDLQDQAMVEAAVLKLKRSLLRILLYFQGYMDARFQWSYQFFNSYQTQQLGVVSNRRLESFNQTTVANCIEEYQRMISASSSASTPTLATGSSRFGVNSSPCHNLRTQLVHSLADFGLGISSYQSPLKPLTSSFSRSHPLQKHFPPVPIRNYMYILSPLPRSWTDTVQFLDGKRLNPTESSMAGPRTGDILSVLHRLKDTFFDQGLWGRFLDHRLSLSWIDTGVEQNDLSNNTKPQTRISTSLLIRSTLELIMKAFGGHIMPYSILFATLAPQDVYTFASVFHAYRSLQINPGLGVKMSKADWQPLPSAQTKPTQAEHPIKVVWSGELCTADWSKVLCNVDIGEVQAGPASSGSTNVALGQVQSIQVLKRLPQRTINSSTLSMSVAANMMFFPQDNKGELCEHASYLLRSLFRKKDVLLLEVTFAEESPKDNSEETRDDGEGSEETGKSESGQESGHILEYTHQAILYPTAPGNGLLQVLVRDLTLEAVRRSAPSPTSEISARLFSMGMMEKPWAKLAGYVDQVDSPPATKLQYHFASIPACVLECFKETTPQAVEAKPSNTKPLPGQPIEDVQFPALGLSNVESIDSLCLGIRKSYMEHLYHDDCTVIEYVRRLNTASKSIAALAAKQSVPLKEAQQKVVAFMIEFLRIWPSRMASKYKQLSKELNEDASKKVTEVTKKSSSSQDHYVILQDERPELEHWKVGVLRSLKDSEVRMQLKRLKTKDTQIQIVQNLHILLLIEKYGLEENKPFKKDPGAAKTINLFMDELCIAASIEDRPAPGLVSPQTPRSKDMDGAKRFYTRVVERYYGEALPKVAEKLAVKCGVSRALLLTSPKPMRISRGGMKRTVSTGVLKKSKAGAFAGVEDDLGGLGGDGEETKDGQVADAPKYGFPMSRKISANGKSTLDSIFRNRQVVMTKATVKGLDSVTSGAVVGGVKARPGLKHSQSQPLLRAERSSSTLVGDDEMEDEDVGPQIASMRLKRFYHDKESQEVLKSFQRTRPLSKAEGLSGPSNHHGSFISRAGLDDDDDDDIEEEDDGELEDLGKYLPKNGTTSWGVIKSTSAKSSSLAGGGGFSGHQSGSTSSAVSSSRRVRSPAGPLSPLSRAMARAAPVSASSQKQPQEQQLFNHYNRQGQDQRWDEGKDDQVDRIQTTPSTPLSRMQQQRYMEDYDLSASRRAFPTTPTRKDHIHQGRNFATLIRGTPQQSMSTGKPLSSTSSSSSSASTFVVVDKRRREEDDDDDELEEEPEGPIMAVVRRTKSSSTFTTASATASFSAATTNTASISSTPSSSLSSSLPTLSSSYSSTTSSSSPGPSLQTTPLPVTLTVPASPHKSFSPPSSSSSSSSLGNNNSRTGRSCLFDDMRITRPDRKRIHLEDRGMIASKDYRLGTSRHSTASTSVTYTQKILVPGTPSSSSSSLTCHSLTTTTTTTTTSRSRDDNPATEGIANDDSESTMDKDVDYWTTPKKANKFLQDLTPSGMFITSPTPLRIHHHHPHLPYLPHLPTRRPPDFSALAADD